MYKLQLQSLVELDGNSLMISRNGSQDYIYLLQKGWVKLVYYSSEGDEIILDLWSENQSLLIYLAQTGYFKGYSVAAFTKCRLLKLTKSQYLEYLNDNGFDLRNFKQIAYKEMLLINSRLIELLTSCASKRTLKALQLFVDRFGIIRNNQVCFNYRLTHEQLAQASSLCRETVSRILLELEKQNLLKLSYSQLKILDYSAFCAKLTE